MRYVLSCLLMLAFAAPLSAGEVDAEASGTKAAPAAEKEAPAATEASAAPAGDELSDFLAKVDAKAEKLRSLSADLTYTRSEEFSNRARKRTGRIRMKKPDRLYIEFDRPYPRRIWITEKLIFDYKPDLNTAEKVILAEGGGGPEIIGLTTPLGELRERFDMELQGPSEPGGRSILILKPKEGVRADFTTARVFVDAKSLLPVKIVQKDERLGVTKTFEFSDIKENPKLPDKLFVPDVAKNTDVAEHRLGQWKGI